MARKCFLNIPPLWHRYTTEAPAEWAKWLVGLQMALVANDNIDIQLLLRNRLIQTVIPSEPVIDRRGKKLPKR